MKAHAIEAVQLNRSFADVRAVCGLDLAVRPGEIFGLIGPDGAGKTTTLRLLAGLLRPNGGCARIAGVDVAAHPQRVRALLGYLPQAGSLLDHLSVAENLRYFADLYCVPAAEIGPRAERLLHATGLTEFTARRAHDLSGGMRQKLSLVCALIHRPQVLLLDEPTRGVDPVSRRDLWRVIYALPGEGVTVLVSTAYADEAERCARLGVIRQGRVVDTGTPQQLVGRHLHQVVELRVGDSRRARELLRGLPTVRTVAVLGEVLRVITYSATQPRRLQAALEAAGMAVSSAELVPGRLDDVLLVLGGAGDG